MNFLRYCFSPTGFGKTSWPQAIIIHAFGGLGIYYTYESYWALLGLMPVAVLWYGTYKNYTGRWV
jgi:hypothetical protein